MYCYKLSFATTVVDPSPPPRKWMVQIAGLVTGAAVGTMRCITSHLVVPLREAEVTLPADEDWSLVNTLDVEVIPTDGAVKIWGNN